MEPTVNTIGPYNIPLAINAAMGKLQGYSFDEVVNRVPLFARARYDRETLEKAADMVHSCLPAVWAWSKHYFEVQGEEKVRVYRGLSWAPVAEIARQLSDPNTKCIYLGMNPVSSWTTDKRYAYRYARGRPDDKTAGVVVSLEIPVERIVYSTEATRELEKGEAPEILICSGFDEIFRIPRDSIEVLRRERGPLGEEEDYPDPCVTREIPGVKNPIIEIDDEVDAYTWLVEAEYLMEYDTAYPGWLRHYGTDVNQ